jgi:TP901 family phage tail tape measure protein
MPVLTLGVQTQNQQAIQAMNQMKMAVSSMSRVVKSELVPALDAMEKEMNDASNATANSTRHDKNKKKSLNEMAGAFLKAQIQMIAIQLAMKALRTVFVDTVKAAIAFNKEFANVTTLVDTAKVNTEEMERALFNLDNRLGSATELTKGLYQTLSAGVDAANAVQFVGEAAKFAKAGLTETETAVDVLTTTLNAYGLAATEVTRVSDIFFQTIKLGKINGEQLASTLGNVVPLAANLNVSIEELGATMAIFTKQGINAANSTTRMNALMTSFLKPSEAMTEALKNMGFESGSLAVDKLGGLKNAVDAIIQTTGISKDQLSDFRNELVQISESATSSEEETQLMNEAFEQFKDSAGASKDVLAQLFPNVRALQGALALTGAGAAEFDSILQEVIDSGGAMEEAFNKQKLTIDAMKNSLDKTAIVFGKALVPMLESAAASITELSDEFRIFLQDSKEFELIQKILSSVFTSLANIGGLLVKIFTGGVADTIRVVADVVMDLSTALGDASGEFDLIQIALAPIMISLKTIDFVFRLLANTIQLAADLIKAEIEFIGTGFKTLKSVIDTIGQGFIDFGDIVSKGTKAVILSIAGIFDEEKRKEAALMWVDASKSFNNFTKNIVKGTNDSLVLVQNANRKHMDDQNKAWGKFGSEVVDDFVDVYIGGAEKIVEANGEMIEILKEQNEKGDLGPTLTLPGDEGGPGGGGDGGDGDRGYTEAINIYAAMSEAAKAAADSIITDFQGVAGEIGKIGKDMINAFSGAFDIIADDSSTLGDKILAGISAGLQAAGSLIESVFATLGQGFDEQIARLEEQAAIELEKFDTKEQDKVAIAQAKLEELQAAQEESDVIMDEQRLAELEQYKLHIQGLTDEDIERALKQKELEIRGFQETEKIKNKEQIEEAKRALEEAKREKTLADQKTAIEDKLEADKNEIQKKAFNTEKAGNIAKVWIQAGLGVISAWASAMQLGPIAGPILAGILTTAILGIAAGQTASIATRQYPSFQDGVTNFGGGTALVGERGPELVTLGRGANVVTNENTNRILSSMNTKAMDSENNINYITENHIYIDGELMEIQTIENRRFAENRIGVN